MDDGLKAAIKAAGNASKLAKLLGISHSAVLQWDKVPADRVLEIEAKIGIARERLRPDLYRVPPPITAAR